MRLMNTFPSGPLHCGALLLSVNNVCHCTLIRKNHHKRFAVYIALFSEWAQPAADRIHHCSSASKVESMQGGLLDAIKLVPIVSGSIDLVFRLVEGACQCASFARKTLPYSPLRAFSQHRAPPAGPCSRAMRCG